MAGKSATLSSSALSAEISALGAELVQLRDRDGRDLLWHGDPAFWGGRAPLLFPIVGRLPHDELVHDGRRYGMKQHGFARRSLFDLVELQPQRAVFRLLPNAETRAQYPFTFALDVAYELTGASLAIEATLRNRGPESLPASFGFHPAFLWPLPYGGRRADHRLIFEQPETGPVHRPSGGLLSAATEPNPAARAILTPDDAMFERDALIFLNVRSRHVRYGVPDGPGLEIAFPGMPDLGLWTKPGAPFLCIEPWAGHATPEGDERPFVEKPGLVHLPPGAEHDFAMTIRWLPDITA
ncbi:aldose 1-epimerase family protein [Xanthobacter dioxanivorans]|uniref:Aldose 1-epimerase family protein n=1 Tax=Xanthobacter dioxanivorans TaxID=2528964 RepID=A0A974SH26_9HYPH|nr:aldose 1-epimerase family protein [Xanthobacter dioxanivorans]QRG04674.1 aldose 1-epimerase family protein [Xanthobacter dioxanivorans]